jgi:hypothetical protein
MDLGIRIRVRSGFTLNRGGDGWSRQVWDAFALGDVAQRRPPDQRSGGTEEDQLAGMNPGGAMLFLFCFSNVGKETRWWCRTGLPPSPPSLDQIEYRSSSTNCSPSFFSFCSPPTKNDARPRTCDAWGARSPAAVRCWRVESDAGAVGKGGERCAVKVNLRGNCAVIR